MRILRMVAPLSMTDEVRLIVRQKGFRVKLLASHFGMDVRTLERRFRAQLGDTPKAWLMRERMMLAPPLLSAGLSNKEVAASLRYSCESNFCRDFKRYYGHAPQRFIQIKIHQKPNVAF